MARPVVTLRANTNALLPTSGSEKSTNVLSATGLPPSVTVAVTVMVEPTVPLARSWLRTTTGVAAEAAGPTRTADEIDASAAKAAMTGRRSIALQIRGCTGRSVPRRG